MPEQPHAPRARPQLCSSSSTSISQSPSPSKAPLLIIHNNLHAPVESRTRIRPMPAGELQLPVNSQSTAGFDSIETTFISRFRIALHHDCRLGNGRSQVIRTQNRSRIALDRKHKQYGIARRTTLQLPPTSAVLSVVVEPAERCAAPARVHRSPVPHQVPRILTWTCLYAHTRIYLSVLGSCPGGMRGRNGRVCRVQNIPRQNTLKREFRTGVR